MVELSGKTIYKWKFVYSKLIEQNVKINRAEIITVLFEQVGDEFNISKMLPDEKADLEQVYCFEETENNIAKMIGGRTTFLNVREDFNKIFLNNRIPVGMKKLTGSDSAENCFFGKWR